MATETDFRLDVAARLVTELQDRYRLPGETWGLVFDGDAEGDPDAMSDEDALRRIRGMSWFPRGRLLRISGRSHQGILQLV